MGPGKRGGGSAQAAGPSDSAGDRPWPVLGGSLPVAEPPRPCAEVWALGGPSLIHSGPEPVPDTGRVETERVGGIHPAPRPDCETRESPPNQPKSLAQGQFGSQVKAQSKSRRGKVVKLLVLFSKKLTSFPGRRLCFLFGWAGEKGRKGIWNQ